MKWSDLLSPIRLGGDLPMVETKEEKYPSTEFEKDYRRIIASASFRRLQDKTQVFPLDQSDFVRTRLTHSYETSSLAKTMGSMLLKVLNAEKFDKWLDEADKAAIGEIPEILACAGLLHDIGNPPFGHFGEEIIKKWFEANLGNILIEDLKKPGLVDGSPVVPPQIPLNESLHNVYQNDLKRFDGNAQALRVLSRLHFTDNDCGLNLTSAVLNTLIKYPSASCEVKKKKDEGYSILTKKMGYFYDDQANFEAITINTGAGKNRHPLAFVLEAADDIAYKTADIEDGFKKGLFTLDELTTFINGKIEEYKKNDPENTTIKYVVEIFDELNVLRAKGKAQAFEKKINDVDLYAVQNWVHYAQEWLMYCAIYGFHIHYEKIMKGSYLQDLFFDTNHELSVKIIDQILAHFIYPNRSIVKLELAANTILENLLSKFVKAALFYDGKYTNEDCVEIQAYKKLYNLISDNYRENYRLAFKQKNPIAPEENVNFSINKNTQYDIYLRLLLVVDYISGMTDSYAKSLYQELNGIYGLVGIY